ncbi:MAG: acyl-CoA thioesterase domain-containing protein, partial [Pseudomonadota bacterium]
MSEYDEVVASFNLERLDDNRFRSRSPQFGWRRIYGGLLLSHGLRAAQLTMDDPQRDLHSLHGYFLRPGLIDEPLELQVNACWMGAPSPTAGSPYCKPARRPS